MEDDDVCEYDSTWDTESDGDDPAGESQTRRSCPEKNRSGWSLNVPAFVVYDQLENALFHAARRCYHCPDWELMVAVCLCAAALLTSLASRYR